MVEQKIMKASESYWELDAYLRDNYIKRILLVCGSSVSSLRINHYFENLEKRMGIKVIRFSDFKPNPLYESVVAGIEVFHNENCDSIIAVGGGSAIDVAKCIKLYSGMDSSKNYLEQIIVPNDIRLLAIPTTAGTGSEATRYAVIYYKGEKQSIADDSCIPQAVLMDASLLKALPEYQRKATMMDAFCQAIESFWSVNSTGESKRYAKDAIRMILGSMELYLQNDEIGNAVMLEAANIAGKAINITQTTAGHAMSYKLTSMYGIAHGHAVALCVSKLWPYMATHLENCTDPRGKVYLDSLLKEIAAVMNCGTVDAAIEYYNHILANMNMRIPKPDLEDFVMLKTSVNPVRLKNTPISLELDAIDWLYHQILEA